MVTQTTVIHTVKPSLFEEFPGVKNEISITKKSLTAVSRVKSMQQQAPLHCHHATASRTMKGEDVMFIHPISIGNHYPSYVYMVCDGHCGVDAASWVADNFLHILEPKLPDSLPEFTVSVEVEYFAEKLRRALCETFVAIDNQWSELGHFAGTTVTVALATGWLLTVANAGDSSAVLDTGASMLELIRSHRIHDNLEEQARLKKANQCLAPLGFHLQGPAKPGEQGVGPLRLWPGGLCVSRSVGDLDAGPEVVPVPHIRQLMMPADGCRIIIASDGLWDVLTYSKALQLTRSKPTGAAASALITAVSRDHRCQDDASIIVVDFLPSESTSFPTVALKAGMGPDGKQKKAARPKSSAGFFACFKPEPSEPDSREVPVGGLGHVAFLADIDCYIAYPGIQEQLQRTSVCAPGMRNGATANRVIDYTMHGGGVYRGNPARANSSPAQPDNRAALLNGSHHPFAGTHSEPMEGSLHIGTHLHDASSHSANDSRHRGHGQGLYALAMSEAQ